MSNSYVETESTNHIVDKRHDQFNGIGADVDTPVFCGEVIPAEDIQSVSSHSRYDSAATVRTETEKDICPDCMREAEEWAAPDE